jgi:ribosomal protein S18 acetylase RimI-like enzyme
MPALAAAPQQVKSEPMNRTIRPLAAADRSGVFRILENAGNFTPEEVATALELIDEWLELGEHSGYLTYVLEARDEDSSAVLGYVCFGPTPLTESTFDLYWIAVDKSKHRGGVGKRLLKFTEEEIVRRGGKMLLIETSSQETYGGTIQFYERTGYDLVGKIPEYYKPGDDKLIFAKQMVQGVPADGVAPAESAISGELVAEAAPQGHRDFSGFLTNPAQ